MDSECSAHSVLYANANLKQVRNTYNTHNTRVRHCPQQTSRTQSASNDANDMSIVSPRLETSDPNPNIWQLFAQFDELFFEGVLKQHCIELSWNSQMTRSAGLCSWNPLTNYCSIQLSQPLLQFRSRKDLVETLIHEMIHALLFVTHTDDNHESHGPLFHEYMNRINKYSGTNVTIYHSFYDEINYYSNNNANHVWRCDGVCQHWPPYYGIVRRVLNRVPQSNDFWYPFHQQICGGNFTRISDPSLVFFVRNDGKNKLMNKWRKFKRNVREVIGSIG